MDDLSAAVPSFLGLRMTLSSQWLPVTLTAIDPGSALAGTLVRCPAAGLVGRRRTGRRHDRAVRREPRRVRRSRRGPASGSPALAARSCWTVTCPAPPSPKPGVTGLTELSVINRAIGVLITRGHPPGQARAELVRRAAAGRIGVTDAARHMLASTNAPPTRPFPAGTPRPATSR